MVHVAGEGRVLGVPMCTMPLMNVNSDWMSNASSGLCISLFMRVLYFGSWGVIFICKNFYIIRNNSNFIKAG